MASATADIAPHDPPVGIDALTFRVDRRLPVSDQVYEALRQAIVSVQLGPGAMVSENSIVRRFGVSRTPIRAALQRLAEEGLIDVFPQQGSFVAPIRLSEIKDSHFVRCTLEVAIIEEAARIWNAERSAMLRDSVDRHAARVAAGDLGAFYEGDEEFHRLFAEMVGRHRAWEVITQTRGRLMRFYRLFGNAERLAEAIAEHRLIIDALDAGDIAAARIAMVDHLDKIFKIADRLPEKYRDYLTE